MTDSTNDRVSGVTDETKGKVKEGWGNLTDNDQARTEGKADQAKGKLEQGVADVKDKVEDVVDDIRNR